MRIALLVSVLIGSVFCLNSWAADGSSPEWDKRLTLRGGAISYSASGDFSSTRDGREKVTLDLDDLGLDEDELSYFLGANLRLGDRWRLRFDYFRYHDDSKKTNKEFVEFDDLIVPPGGRIDSKLDLDLYVVNLSYDLYKSERAAFGIGIGAHVADFELKVSGKHTVDDEEVNLGSGSADITAPLPNLYVSGIYAFRDNVIFRYGGGWMSMDYDDYDGELIFANGALEYWPHKNVGFGAGYSYISADIDYDNGNKKENYDIDLPGPLAYITVGF